MQIQPVASHFINGEYVEDTSGTPIDIVYPAIGEIIGRVYGATEAVIEQAITSAKRAQKKWAKISGTERVAFCAVPLISFVSITVICLF